MEFMSLGKNVQEIFLTIKKNNDNEMVSFFEEILSVFEKYQKK